MHAADALSEDCAFDHAQGLDVLRTEIRFACVSWSDARCHGRRGVSFPPNARLERWRALSRGRAAFECGADLYGRRTAVGGAAPKTKGVFLMSDGI